ncbi:MAG: AhpC/TSA family protein [Bacteroidetes bacterium]|nr:AhpC/TSA family protein [Fibrella sp.]
MKKISGILAILGLISLTVVAQSPAEKSVTITGKVKTIGMGERVYLETSGQPSRRLDSADVQKDKSFTLKTQLPDGGGIFLLNIANAQRLVVLLAGGEKLDVVADGFATDLKTGKKGTATVTGSKNMDDYQQLMIMKTDMDTRVAGWNQQYTEATQKKDQKRMEAIQRDYEGAEKMMVTKVKALLPGMGTSLAALFATNFLNPETDFPTLDTLARRFEKENPNSPQAKSFIGNMARIRGVMVGSEAPEIALNDTTGKAVPLSTLRGKYVLIDFWASWCGPCRQENPNVVRMYNKFKEKGFAIYSVSLDQSKANWVKAIRNDNLTWTHVSDLKYWQSAAAQQYGVQAIPQTFLIDKEGKIIAKNLRGEALEQKLEEVLKTAGN